MPSEVLLYVWQWSVLQHKWKKAWQWVNFQGFIRVMVGLIRSWITLVILVTCPFHEMTMYWQMQSSIHTLAAFRCANHNSCLHWRCIKTRPFMTDDHFSKASRPMGLLFGNLKPKMKVQTCPNIDKSYLGISLRWITLWFRRTIDKEICKISSPHKWSDGWLTWLITWFRSTVTEETPSAVSLWPDKVYPGYPSSQIESELSLLASCGTIHQNKEGPSLAALAEISKWRSFISVQVVTLCYS